MRIKGWTQECPTWNSILLCHSEGAERPKNLVMQFVECDELTNMVSKQYYVYILTSNSGTLYTGITNDLARRVFEHKNQVVKGFTKKYNIKYLVYYEAADDVESAIA